MLCSQLFHLDVVFKHELRPDPVHHVVSVLLVDSFSPSGKNRNAFKQIYSCKRDQTSVVYLTDASCFSWSSSRIISLIFVQSSKLVDFNFSSLCFSSLLFFSSNYSFQTSPIFKRTVNNNTIATTTTKEQTSSCSCKCCWSSRSLRSSFCGSPVMSGRLSWLDSLTCRHAYLLKSESHPSPSARI